MASVFGELATIALKVSRSVEGLNQANQQLTAALHEVRTLKGIFPICSHCSMIRNEDENGENPADYITRRSEAVFSHTVCDKCMIEHHPNTATRMDLS